MNTDYTLFTGSWIDTIFNLCVHFLFWLARLLGLTYNEINVWIFCIIWPLFTLGLIAGVIILWRKNSALKEHLRLLRDDTGQAY